MRPVIAIRAGCTALACGLARRRSEPSGPGLTLSFDSGQTDSIFRWFGLSNQETKVHAMLALILSVPAGVTN